MNLLWIDLNIHPESVGGFLPNSGVVHVLLVLDERKTLKRVAVCYVTLLIHGQVASRLGLYASPFTDDNLVGTNNQAVHILKKINTRNLDDTTQRVPLEGPFFDGRKHTLLLLIKELRQRIHLDTESIVFYV
jgi:hypothetical protein